MRFNILITIAAVALLSACGTTPQEEVQATDTGARTEVVAAPAPAPQPAPAPVAKPQPAPVPAGPIPGSLEDFLANAGDRVFFDYDKSDLSADAQFALRRQADWLMEFPAVTVRVEGHCDERGTREYNLALGERRANAVRDYLVSLGVNPQRLDTISYGKERPAVVGSNEEAWAQNRRAVTTIAIPGAGN